MRPLSPSLRVCYILRMERSDHSLQSKSSGMSRTGNLKIVHNTFQPNGGILSSQLCCTATQRAALECGKWKMELNTRKSSQDITIMGDKAQAIKWNGWRWRLWKVHCTVDWDQGALIDVGGLEQRTKDTSVMIVDRDYVNSAIQINHFPFSGSAVDVTDIGIIFYWYPPKK